PEEQFGKTMRIPDSLLPQWYRLVMQRDPSDALGNPLQAKLELARFIVERAHGAEAAARAEDNFTRVTREGIAPEEVEEEVLPDGESIHLPALLADGMGVPSTSEARRLIAQGAVKIDGEV